MCSGCGVFGTKHPHCGHRVAALISKTSLLAASSPLYCWPIGVSSGSSSFGDSGDVLRLFAEEQSGEESERRRRKRKGSKRKRDARGPEGGTCTCDLKLDDALDRTLEDGAKQHNLTAVNVRNILHVSRAVAWSCG